MQSVLLRGVIAACAVVCVAACSVNPDKPTEKPVPPHVWVEWAQDCGIGPGCPKHERPETIRLRVGHKHDVTIGHTEDATVVSQFSVPDIVHYEVIENTARTDAGPRQATWRMEAVAIGGTTLNIALEQDEVHAADHSALRIRTMSPRVTVVAWVDAKAINPDEIAPNAGELVKAQFSTKAGCAEAVSDLARYITNADPIPFLRADPQERAEDGLYAQAVLVRTTANRRPRENLAELGNDYRLMNDFQAIGGDGPVFDDERAPHKAAKVGVTPPPCGAATLIDNDLIHAALEKISGSDGHPLNEQRFEKNGAVTQINQGRVGKLGRMIQHALTATELEEDELTPWVWSVISFDRSTGKYFVQNAGFPTYFVYIDGKLKKQCGTEQAPFEDFLQRDARSQFDLKHFEPTSVLFDRGGCP